MRSGLLPLTDEQRARVADQHRVAMAHVLRVERVAIAVGAELRRRGVDFRLLKGVALAHGVYADPASRALVDGDLVVEPGSIGAAVCAVGALGGRRFVPELRPGFDARFGKDIPMIVDGVAIDLHRTLISGPYGVTLPVDRLFRACRPVVIGGCQLPALDVVDAYLHAASPPWVRPTCRRA